MKNHGEYSEMMKNKYPEINRQDDGYTLKYPEMLLEDHNELKKLNRMAFEGINKDGSIMFNFYPSEAGYPFYFHSIINLNTGTQDFNERPFNIIVEPEFTKKFFNHHMNVNLDDFKFILKEHNPQPVMPWYERTENKYKEHAIRARNQANKL